MIGLKKHTGTILFSVITAVIGVACGVVPYFALAAILSQLLSGVRDYQAFVLPLVYIVVGFAGAIMFHTISTLTSHNLAFRIIEDTRKRVTEKISRLSMGTIEEKSSGKWTQFITEMLDKMEQPIAHVIPEVIANLIIPAVLVIVIFILNWKIGIANLLTLPLGMLFSMLMMKDYETRSKNYIEASKKMNAAAVEYIHGIKVIKAFNQSASSYGAFKEAVIGNRDAMLDWYLSVCFAMTAVMEVLPSTLIFVLPTALFLCMDGGIAADTALLCVIISYASYKPLLKAMAYMDTIANVRVIFGEIASVLKLPELQRTNTAPDPRTFTVSFEGVSFGYQEKKVFENLSFTAEEGKLTAIVGASGSGKSTIAKLLAGFWNVDGGCIKIGDAVLHEMSLERNMHLVTYLSQENFLFDKTIAENLRMAKENASQAEIEAACKKASCHDFIVNLPKGYETQSGDSGTSFSGGERQRITIARAFLKDSPIIVLDEATAYSDPENEHIIQQSISRLTAHKTVIMIAHRLSTIVNADKIIVLDKGIIAAQGRHTELLETSPLYKSMWQSHISGKDSVA